VSEKIIQISTCQESEDNVVIHALTNLGRVYVYQPAIHGYMTNTGKSVPAGWVPLAPFKPSSDK
jgi:hypothetical protein